MGKDVRIMRTREALHRALLALLEHKPLDQITIREITASARIGYATFFRHHPTKESLLEDLATEQIERLVALTLPVLESVDGRASCRALCDYVMEHRTLWSALLAGGAAGAMREEFIRVSKQVAAKRVNHLSWLPTDLGVIFSASAILEILTWWLRQSDNIEVERIAEIIDRLVISPLDVR